MSTSEEEVHIDLYKILHAKQEVANDPNCDKILLKLYNKQLLAWHPDKNSSPEAPKMLKLINLAYNTLKDKESRRIYHYNLGSKAATRGHSDFKSDFQKFIEEQPRLDESGIRALEEKFKKEILVKPCVYMEDSGSLDVSLKDLMQQRNIMEQEVNHVNYLKGDFSAEKFNELFERMKESTTGNDLIPWDQVQGIDNDLGFDINGNNGSLNLGEKNRKYVRKEIDMEDLNTPKYKTKINDDPEDIKRQQIEFLKERERDNSETGFFSDINYINVNPWKPFKDNQDDVEWLEQSTGETNEQFLERLRSK